MNRYILKAKNTCNVTKEDLIAAINMSNSLFSAQRQKRTIELVEFDGNKIIISVTSMKSLANPTKNMSSLSRCLLRINPKIGNKKRNGCVLQWNPTAIAPDIYSYLDDYCKSNEDIKNLICYLTNKII